MNGRFGGKKALAGMIDFV